MWITLKEFQKNNKEGICWIAYKGRVTTAYYDYNGLFRFSKHNHNAYLRECITGIYPIIKPEYPTTKPLR